MNESSDAAAPNAAPSGDEDRDEYNPELYGGAAFDPDRGVVSMADAPESPQLSGPQPDALLPANEASRPAAETATVPAESAEDDVVPTVLAGEIPLELDADAARHAFAAPSETEAVPDGVSSGNATPEIQRQTMAYRQREPENAPEQRRPIPWMLLAVLFFLVVLAFAWNEATAEWDANGNMLETSLFRRFHVLKKRIEGTNDPQSASVFYRRVQQKFSDSKAAELARQAANTISPQKVLIITSTPEGADIELDGKPIGTTPFAGETEVTAGKHRLKLTRKGYRDLETEQEVTAAEDEIRWKLILVPAGASKKNAAKREEGRADSSPAQKTGEE